MGFMNGKALSRVTDVLNHTDTRDSVTEVLQYTARLASGLFPSQELACRRVYNSLSEGRKIFRLLRFVPEIRDLADVNESDPVIRRLTVAQSGVSAAFYLLDNWIYFQETVKRKSRGDIRPVKYVKNRVSLIRVIIGLLLTIAVLHRELRQKSEFVSSHRLRESSRNDHSEPLRPNVILSLLVRLWHESLRMWLTLHKLHLLDLFMSPKRGFVPIDELRRTVNVLPGAVGLASAVTALVRKTVLSRRL